MRAVPGLLLALERFVLPNACIHCERTVERRTPDALLCGVCVSRMRGVAPGCTRCHHPLPPIGPCRFCAAWPAQLHIARSAVWLGPEARSLIHHLKYQGFRRLACLAADLMVRRSPTAPVPHAILVPVPLTPKRERRRGFNQAADLAHALGIRWGIPVVSVLRRIPGGGSQTVLTPLERATNVAGVFQATPPSPDVSPVPPRIARAHRQPATPAEAARRDGGAAVILVDDVLTTGATVAAAAMALARAGWRDIEAVTFARALPFALRATVL